MPGIVGIIRRNSSNQNKAFLGEMLQCMMHEKFYTGDKYTNEALGLYVGWTCFNDHLTANSPVWNERRDICLIFTGEHYGDADGCICSTPNNGDSDVKSLSWLVRFYEKEGLEALRRLNGWFSGVLVDLRRAKIFLFNDRYGVSRIFYHDSADGFYFSSEAKSLLKILPETRGLDLVGLGEFFTCGCVLQDRSFFPGIALLPGASVWEFSPQVRIKKQTYFDREEWENQPRLSGEKYYEKLKEVFPAVLKRYLSGSKRIGVSLTGGVDSRMIMAWAQSASGFLPCYTFGGKYRESVDVKIARRVARFCDQPHQVIRVGREFINEFPSLAERTVYLTDGAMDVSGAADLYVNQMARQIAPIRLTGNYGGEILRELVAFKPVAVHEEAFSADFRSYLRAGAQTYAVELQERRLSFVAFKQVPWHHYARLSLERSQIYMRSPYLDNNIVKLAYQTPQGIAQSNEPALRLITDGNPQLGKIGTDRGVSRRPIPVITNLRHRYQEFTFKAEYAYDYGMPHTVAKIDALLGPLHLERLFLGRHKFHHFRIWYRDELSQFLKDVLLDPRTLGRPYLRSAPLADMVRDHARGIRNYTLEFHRILTIELLQRQLIETR